MSQKPHQILSFTFSVPKIVTKFFWAEENQRKDSIHRFPKLEQLRKFGYRIQKAVNYGEDTEWSSAFRRKEN